MKDKSASNEIFSPPNEEPTAADVLNPLTEAVVEVTRGQWTSPLLMLEPGHPFTTLDTIHTPSAVRDRFLNLLDSDDYQLLKSVALNLVRSRNPLPGMTCEELGLPPRSTYGAAARHVLARR